MKVCIVYSDGCRKVARPKKTTLKFKNSLFGLVSEEFGYSEVRRNPILKVTITQSVEAEEFDKKCKELIDFGNDFV